MAPPPTTVLIRVEDGDDCWPVHLFVDNGREDWLSVPVESARVAVLAPEELEDMRTFVLEEEQSSQRFERIGTRLYQLLADGPIGSAWGRTAAAGGGRLRLLLDARPDGLSRLPWELMRRGPRAIAADIDSPFARVSKSFPGAAEPRPVRWPLRVMVVVGSEPDDVEVAAESELAGLRDAFRRMCGLLDMEILHQPSRDRVQTCYRQLRPHVFHFIGHGSVEDGKGRLELFNRESDENVPWTSAEILMDLAGWQPRLAILNACRSTSLEEQIGAWRVAEAFLELGAPGVIAMQGDIQGEAAAAFTGGLYRSLVKGEPLDVAAAAGRAAITRSLSVERRDFALPSLTVSAPPEKVLRTCFGIASQYRDSVETRHPRLKGFVDRSAERRRLWRRIDPAPEFEAESDGGRVGAIAIHGGPQVGKSELAQWCVGTCQLHGGNAAYVELSRDSRLTFLQVLHLIRRELEDSAVHGERNRAAFDNWTMMLKAAGIETEGAKPRPPAPDAIETIFTAFGDALRVAAQESPVLIALDHVSGVQEENWELLRKLLLVPVAEHRLEHVRFIVVLSDEQRGGWLSDDTHGLTAQVELRAFKPDEFLTHARWYFAFHFDVDPKEVDKVMMIMPIREEWTWETLTDLERVAPKFGWTRSAL
jgi:hypothetical protein